MAQKVTAMDVRMAAALAGGVGNVSEFCREQGISRQTFYKWRVRVAELGVEGLQELSRRPLSSPQAISTAMGQLLALTRKELLRDGCDAGADSILDVLTAQPRRAEWGLGLDEPWPNRRTVHRHLVREGLVEAVPQRRPRSSMRRFTYARPNECWQSDWTWWHLADGTAVAVAGTLDDHSRLICGLRAAIGDATGTLVWQAMTDAFGRYGIPAMSLTDNGSVYSNARRRGPGEAAFELNLRLLGVVTVTSSPYHPQTCGKIERFWQTLKKWLAARPAATTLDQFQLQLDAFSEYYNQRRKHSALGRQTPQQTWQATVAARPAERPLPAPVHVHHTQVGPNGNLNLCQWLIGVGRTYAGKTLTSVRDGLTISLFDGTQYLATLTITDPARRFHRAPTARAPYRRRA